MNQLKFVRSKSSSRKNQLQYVHKPGKLDISVGKRTSNQNIHISTPKEKVENMLLLLKTHKNLQTPNKIYLPLSHDNNNNDYQFQNIYNNQAYLDVKQSLQKSTITQKLDAFQLKMQQFNQTEDQPSPTTTMFGTTMNSQFNYQKDILKQSLLINQQHNSEQKYIKYPKTSYKSKENTTNFSSHKQTPIQDKPYDEIILDIYPQFIQKCQQNGQLKKIIVEQTEEEDYLNTKNSTLQRPQLYSELLTDKSLVLVSPKTVKDIELQTSVIKEPKLINSNCGTQCDTANVQVQTKLKKKNLGIFQYQLSYLSPQNNKNQKDIDLLSLEDFQSQILYRTQSEFEKDFSNLRSSQDKQKNTLNKNDSRSILLNQKSNIYMTKEQLLDPQDDTQPYYLQAEPKEINPNIYSIKQTTSQQKHQKKKKESTSFSTYKDHLNILMNSSGNIRTSQNNPKKQVQKSKSTKKPYQVFK